MKEAALISPRWKWQNDSSTTLIKKISILKNNSIELEEFIAEIYQTKKDENPAQGKACNAAYLQIDTQTGTPAHHKNP